MQKVSSVALFHNIPDNILTPMSLAPQSNMSVTPTHSMDVSSPNPEPRPETQLTLFKPTGLLLERPPSPAEIPKGTIRHLPVHHFVQLESTAPKIDPLQIKIEMVDPDELQIINHPAKKSKKLVRNVISAIKELQAEQSSLPKDPLPQNQSAAFTDNVVQRPLLDRPRSGNVQQPKS